MEIYLEQPGIGDVKALLELAKITFSDTFEQHNNPADFAEYLDRAFTEQQFFAELSDPSSEFWWAKRADSLNPVGYFKLNKNRPHDAFEVLQETHGRLCELERIYVHPDHKRLGIGQILLKKALNMAKNDQSDWLWLGVWEENHRAISFYERQNFEVFGKHHFRIGGEVQTDLLMRFGLLD